MEKQKARNRPAAALSLDWSNLFDSVQLSIGQGLVKHMADKGNGIRVFEAEERLLGKIRPRFKVGKTMGREPYEKTNGFMQGPNNSITVALALLAVWTRSTEKEANCDTSSFIDDSSIRSKEGSSKEEVIGMIVKAIELSKKFGEMTGTALNMKKVKILVNDNGLQKQVEKKVKGLKDDAVRKAMILVGGVVTTGEAGATQSDRARMQKKNREKSKTR